MIATAAPAPPMPDICLSKDERAQFVECERIIQRGLQHYREVGHALELIRDCRLWREEYGTWEAYLRRRWKLSAPYAYRLRVAAKVADGLPMGNPVPETERVARALAKLPAEIRPAAWERLVAETGGHPTAKETDCFVAAIIWKDLTPEQQQAVIRADAAERDKLARALDASRLAEEEGLWYRRLDLLVRKMAGRGQRLAEVRRLAGLALTELARLVPERLRVRPKRDKRKPARRLR